MYLFQNKMTLLTITILHMVIIICLHHNLQNINHLNRVLPLAHAIINKLQRSKIVNSFKIKCFGNINIP